MPNPLAAQAPELLGHLAAFRDRLTDRLFDQLAASALKDPASRTEVGSHPPEDVRATALVLRVLTKPEWDADDLRVFDACWRTAARADPFAEAFEAERDRIEQLVAAARAEPTATSWVGKVGAPGRRKGGKIAAGPRKAVGHPPAAPPADPTLSASAAPSAPVRCLTADAGDDTAVVLIEDAARGQLRIAFEQPSGPGQPSRAVQAFLRDNGFEEVPAHDGSLWSRPLNSAASFQDRIDGEWVVLRAAEKMQAGRKGRRG